MIKIEKTPLHLVIAEHGALRVLLAALFALLSSPRKDGPEPHLSDHIRRDIGLPPHVAPPPVILPVRW